MFAPSTMAWIALTFLSLISLALTQTTNCVLQVPNNPLTAEGLATPYKMTGCNQTNFATEACFVEAAILDPATGNIQIYNPLVINQDQAKPGVDFIPPVVPKLAPNSVVGIFFGSNAVTLTLTGDTNTCVNGDGNSVFGQFAYCNSPAFFTAADTAVQAGLLKIPPPGSTTKAKTVQPCLVTRDFRMVDMDQSDNVDSTYLLINGTVLAQNTPENAKANPNATEINNGSDNLLLNAFLAPTLGCTPFSAPSITSPTGSSSAMALNELQSTYFVPAGGPALVPSDDDFTVIANNGNVTQSLTKTNLYRAGVGQPPAADIANASAITYCTRYAASGIFIAENEALFSGATSPAPGASSNLFTFMANRFATSFGPVPALGCQTIFGLNTSPVNQTTNGDCVVVAATINTAVLQSIIDGKILPAGLTATSSTTSLAASTSSVLFSNATATASTAPTLVLPTTLSTLSKSGAKAIGTVASATVSTSASVSTSALATATSTSALGTTSSSSTTTTTTTVIVEIISFFIFTSSLGGATPGIVSNADGLFVVLEEVFSDLPSAANQACTHQFNACASLAGSAFSGTDCLSQMNSCQSIATTASPTASIPGTFTASVTVPMSASSSVASVATSEASVASSIESVATACPTAATVTVTGAAPGGGSAGPTGGVGLTRHRHMHRVLDREAKEQVERGIKGEIVGHWKRGF